MPSSSARGQVEPLAALAAVFALGVGLTLYAGALDATVPGGSTDRELTTVAADRLVAEASSLGAVEPPLQGPTRAARPTGYELNATLRAGGSWWTAGPPSPESADCHDRRVSARVAPGRVRPARLEVCAWPAQ